MEGERRAVDYSFFQFKVVASESAPASNFHLDLVIVDDIKILFYLLVRDTFTERTTFLESQFIIANSYDINIKLNKQKVINKYSQIIYYQPKYNLCLLDNYTKEVITAILVNQILSLNTESLKSNFKPPYFDKFFNQF